MEDFFWKHNENLSTIEKSITIIENQLKKTIRQNCIVKQKKTIIESGIKREIEIDKNAKQDEVLALTKILSYLVTCWAEVRILKVIFSHIAFNGSHHTTLTEIEKKNLASNPLPAFSEDEKKFLLNAPTAEERWKICLALSLAKRFGISYLDIQPTFFQRIILKLIHKIKSTWLGRYLDFSIYTRKIKLGKIENILPLNIKIKYEIIINLIEKELLPSIQIRNRIAHGQWITAFSSNLTSIKNDLTANLKLTTSYLLTNENINQLNNEKKLTKVISKKLKTLSDVTYNTKNEFLREIENKIGIYDTNKYKNLLLNIARIDGENIETLQYRLQIFKDLALLIETEVVSLPTFERDFGTISDKIIQNQKNLHNRDFENYQNSLLKKQQDIKNKRNTNTTNIQ